MPLYGHMVHMYVRSYTNCYLITNLLRIFTFTENQTFLQTFYNTKIWTHMVLPIVKMSGSELWPRKVELRM